MVGSPCPRNIINSAWNSLHARGSSRLSAAKPSRCPFATGRSSRSRRRSITNVFWVDMVKRVVTAILSQRGAICKAVIHIAAIEVTLFLGQCRAQHLNHFALLGNKVSLILTGHSSQFSRQEIPAGRQLFSPRFMALTCGSQGCHCRADRGVPIIRRGLLRSASSGRDVESREERLRISSGAGWRRWRSRVLTRQSQNLLPDVIDGLIEVLKPKGFGLFMEAADKHFDLSLMMFQEGVDICLVQDLCALRLRKYEIGKEKESKPAVERDPTVYQPFFVVLLIRGFFSTSPE